MITTLMGHALDWYMKFSVVSAEVAQKLLDQIRVGLIDEFRKPKYESQCITYIKDIKKLSMESVQDFYQRFKTLMAKLRSQMLDTQHKEWFIAALLPHIQIPLMQQKFVSQTEALELDMNCESSPVGETGARMM